MEGLQSQTGYTGKLLKPSELEQYWAACSFLFFFFLLLFFFKKLLAIPNFSFIFLFGTGLITYLMPEENWEY